MTLYIVKHNLREKVKRAEWKCIILVYSNCPSDLITCTFTITTLSVFKISAWNFRNRLQKSKICQAKFRIWPPKFFFWGLNQKSVSKIRRKCDLRSIPKISSKNFKNWFSCYYTYKTNIYKTNIYFFTAQSNNNIKHDI